MAFFSRLNSAIWSYISPVKTPAPRRPQGRRTPEPIPIINVNGKRVRPESTGKKARKRVAFNPLPGPSGMKNLDSDEDYLEGDTLVDLDEDEADPTLVESDEEEPLTPHTPSRTEEYLAHFESPEYKRRRAKNKVDRKPDDDFDENDLKKFDIAAARAQRKKEAQEMREAGWAEDPIKVYIKLAMRGWEPLFPSTWKLSFDTFPSVLFTRDKDQACIKNIHQSEFRAQRAFRQLLNVATKTRDADLPQVSPPPARRPEELLRRAIKKYIGWAWADGGVTYCIPTLAIVSSSDDVPAIEVEAEMTDRLAYLKAEWHNALYVPEHYDEEGQFVPEDYLHEMPTIYGIVISNLLIALVAYEDEDQSLKEPRIRLFATFNIHQAQYDVWTFIAMAIVVMHSRNEMMTLQQVLGLYPSSEEDEVDPDA